MKRKIIVAIFTFLSVLVLPLTNANADDTATYRYKRMRLNSFIDVFPSGMKIGNQDVLIGNHEGYRTLEVHIVEHGNDMYQGYCLHLGKQITRDARLGLHEGFGDLVDSNGSKLDDNRQSVLKNILASGYQNGNRTVDNFVEGNYVGHGRVSNSCVNETACVRTLATQLLVWEIQLNQRTNYDLTPKGNSNYQNFVTQNNKLNAAYTSILSEAYSLTKTDNFPSKGATIVLKWSDSLGKYVSQKVPLGVYEINKSSLPKGVTISKVDSNNNVVIYSENEISKSSSIEVNYVKGDTSTKSQTFRWYKFLDYSNNQDVLMGSYSVTQKSNFNIKTESGKFYVSKIDTVTNKYLTGSKFDLYKCPASTGCTSKNATKIKTIDLTKNAKPVKIDVKKSGKYLLKETVVPYGYTSIGEFTFNVSISASGSTSISSISNNTAKLQISKGTIVKNSLVVGNKPKNITIKKVTVVKANGKNKTMNVKGATFQIKDSKGNLVKFTKDKNGVYRYDTAGKITNIQDDNLSQYMITLLPKGNYTLIETATPYPYTLANKEEDRKTYIQIDKNSNLLTCNSTYKKCTKVTSATVTVKNFNTKVSITKYGNSGKKLPGVKFELYDSKKEKQIPVIETKVGRYRYNTLEGGDPIKLVTNDVGNIIIDNLPAGTYYLKEVETVEGHVIDKDNEWTKFTLTVTKTQAKTVYMSISNAKSEFTFYKIDEDGNYLSAGLFKLQVYNEKLAKFEDVPVIYHEKENYYTIDKTNKSDIYTFTPVNGMVTFKNVDSKTKYRVVEIEAPEGFVLPKENEAYVEIVMNENGYASGDSVLINRKITVEEEASAQAELIINISTGQDRIRYALIIGGILTVIIALFVIKGKLKK